MKKIFSLFAIAAMMIGMVACTDDDDIDKYRTYAVTLQLLAPEQIPDADLSRIEVTALNSTGTSFTAVTDDNGVATFDLTLDRYTFTASKTMANDGVVYAVNYSVEAIITAENFTALEALALKAEAAVSQGSQQLMIKEFYFGGCQKDDGSGLYQFDKYVVIYNNSPVEARLANFGMGMCNPANAHSTNYNVDSAGALVYANEDYTPSWQGVIFLPKEFVLAPYTSATVVLNGAIDHTTTYSNSVDLRNADYVFYHVDGFDRAMNTSYHPAPSETIPTDNYFKIAFVAQGNSWAISNNSPAFFIFSSGGTDIYEYGMNAENTFFSPGKEGNQVYACVKVKNEWILDAVEVWQADKLDTSKERFAPTVNTGYVTFTNAQGYSIYRNVDKAATEALPENEGKLVYNYALGTDSNGTTSTDPSTIDAEASMANGAHIVFQDTNNSGKDFHQRAKASLKK